MEMSKTASGNTLSKLTPRSIREFSSKNAIVLVLIALVIFIGIIKQNFLNLDNLVNILRISSVRVIIALGMTGILISKGVDLSAGRVVGLAAVVAASLAQRADYTSKLYPNMPELSIIIPIVAALFVGFLVGLFNGLTVAYLNVPPFVTTLGTMTIAWGAASLYVDRPPMGAQPLGGLLDRFTNIGSGSIGPDVFAIPIIIIIAAIVFFGYWVALNKMRLGKNVYAIGGNTDAAIVSGVDVKKNLVFVYSIAGLLFGLAGLLLCARTGGATNNYGQSYELDAIAACVIGGISLSGGVGTAGGVLTGVLIFEVLNNGLVVLGVSAYWQMIVKGLIIIAAVALDIRKYTRKR
jgi:methyl-galactoside transport system permease protein